MRARSVDGLAMVAMVLVAWLGGPPIAAAAEARRVLALDFELIDEQADVTPFPEAPARLRMASERLREALRRERVYLVMDSSPIDRDLRLAREQNHTLLDCKGCELELARKLGADRVMLGWVQRVSNLILNLNIEIRDVASGRTLLNKSADLRGNNDRSWQRAVDFIVRDMVERGQHNR